MKKELDTEQEFYKGLEDTDYYILEGFHMRLYDGENEQCYMYQNQKLVDKIQIVHFYLIDSDKKLVGDVQYSKRKDLGNGYTILLVVPEFHARDNRIVFRKLNNARQISLHEVKKLWDNVDEFGIDLTIVSVQDISTSAINVSYPESETISELKIAKDKKKFGKIRKYKEKIYIKAKPSSVRKNKMIENNEKVFSYTERKIS